MRAFCSILLLALLANTTQAMARKQGGATAATVQPTSNRLVSASTPSPPIPASDTRPTIVPADYGRWETLGAGILSPDGKWFAYPIRRVNGEHELRYRPLATDSTMIATGGEQPVFSRNSRWLAYRISATEAEREGLERARKPARHNIGIVDLRAGTTTVLAEVESFEFSADGTRVALRRYPAEGRKGRGTDLVVRDLERDTELTLGNVAEFAWSDNDARLAVIIEAEGPTENGVQLLDATTGTLRALDNGAATYTGLTWRRAADDLTVLSSRPDTLHADTGYAVLAWRGLAGKTTSAYTYDFTADPSFPRELRVAPYRRPLWAEDGQRLFFGIGPREPRTSRVAATDSTKGRASAPEPAAVEIWHASDERVIPLQKRQARQDRERTHLVSWQLGDEHLVRLADDALENVQLTPGQRTALAYDRNPYAFDAMFGRPYHDIYQIDIATGARELVVEKTAFNGTISPGGRYLLYMQDGAWWTYDLRGGARVNLTGALPTSFVDLEDDHPVHERRPYGVAGWTTGDRSVLLQDRFDLWEIRPDGSRATRLTRGAEDSVMHGYLRLDPEERAIDPNKPLYLSLRGEWSKKSGIARLRPGKAVERLVWRDQNIGRLTRARDADIYAFVAQAYDDSPDYFAGGPDLGAARQATRTNPFQDDYAWGRSELVTFTNAGGEKLQGILTYPADYRPGVKYPMIVYIYEKLTQRLHDYVVPSERSPYNVTTFSANGYFVLRPDITFRPRDPGLSIVEAVVPAVGAVLASGMVDPERVGIAGHSWGGYGSAFLATHTRIFAAAIAGAPLTNLVSMYGYTSGNTGHPETGHFEVGQERMEVSLWEDRDAYIRNSTVFGLDSLRTPLLVEFGDKDGNVNFWQGVELYNGARRLGKNVVMLVYNDENHNVAKKSSQIDYHRRQLEWFDHYLKGAPAAPWITAGKPFLERQRELKAAGAPLATP
jgi:dipeptidyl aminopeptidase/acylaminoacyl peptidase